ncbi:alpha/beta hydrolase [Actinoplanes sp. N902-109]|uniref:alpha/beta hydrolase n=1 Tax=Actinoplanes sp. (strain N902-109) TaxID=649831 RepID=UPI0003293401|nr:alpha/beta hydrolase [Actinoplanes sp. N902-109]AGL17372.1 TAP domain-containing protein [Actinoplanes sp. N902-109]
MMTASILALVLTVPPVAAAAPVPPQWEACGSGVQCATLHLPVDWSDPGAGTFGLRMARHPAGDPAARIGTLIYAPGGPGDSGVNALQHQLGRFTGEELRRFDIVSFDPRGVGASHPMPCPAPADPVITSAAGFTQRIADNRAAWQQCRDRYGELWEHADSASTVRDVDAIRAVLGERQISLHGSSYGTMVGELYAERYPARVRAMVLESAIDHSQGTRGFLNSQAWALQDSFDAFAGWCTATACALPGHDARAAYAGALRKSDNGELARSAWELTAGVHGQLYAPDYPALVTLLTDWLAGRPGTIRTPPAPVVPVICNDFGFPVRDFASYQRLLHRAATKDLRYSAGVLAIGTCLGWPQPVTNPQHRLAVHTRTPLLLINSRHDPATGYTWALSISRQLGRSGVLLTYDGAGHGSYGSTACTIATGDAYLTTLTVPERGTVCPA